MIVFAKGSITRPDALAPYIDDEIRVAGELKAEGVLKSDAEFFKVDGSSGC